MEPYHLEMSIPKSLKSLLIVWLWSLYCSHLLQEEAPLMMVEQGSDLWVYQNVIRSHLIAMLL